MLMYKALANPLPIRYPAHMEQQLHIFGAFALCTAEGNIRLLAATSVPLMLGRWHTVGLSKLYMLAVFYREVGESCDNELKKKKLWSRKPRQCD